MWVVDPPHSLRIVSIANLPKGSCFKDIHETAEVLLEGFIDNGRRTLTEKESVTLLKQFDLVEIIDIDI